MNVLGSMPSLATSAGPSNTDVIVETAECSIFHFAGHSSPPPRFPSNICAVPEPLITFDLGATFMALDEKFGTMPIIGTIAGPSNTDVSVEATEFPIPCFAGHSFQARHFLTNVCLSVPEPLITFDLGALLSACSSPWFSTRRRTARSPSYVDDAGLRWVNLAKIQQDRNDMKSLFDWASSAMERVLWFVDPTVNDHWTGEFLKIDDEILSKDDWGIWFRGSCGAVLATIALSKQECAFTEHAEQIQQFLQRLLIHLDELRRHLSRLCQLALTLIVFGSKTFSTFIRERRWFLHHTSHPPRFSNLRQEGFAMTGAFHLSQSLR